MRCRVATWNVWWRFGDWAVRETAILAELARVDADVVCLQETWLQPGGGTGRVGVAAHVPAIDRGVSQSRRVMHHLALEHGRESWRYRHDGWSIGNAVLSRWPIVDALATPLPDGHDPSEHRSALLVVVDSPGGELPVVTTHANFQWAQGSTRSVQLAAVAELAARNRRELPTVLTGDLNAEIDSDEVRQLTGLSPVPVPGVVFFDAWRTAGNAEEPTWSRTNTHAARGTVEPDRRIDHVLVTPPLPDGRGRVVGASRLGLEPTADGEHPSDHFGVVVDLDLAPVG